MNSINDFAVMEYTIFKGDENLVTVAEEPTVEMAVNALREIALLAAADFAQEVINNVNESRVAIDDYHARYQYPNGDVLEYFICNECGRPIEE